MQPIIKWTGSKRSQAETIVSNFPQEIDTYYEPFCGGCSVLYQLLKSNIRVKKYICSDINSDLINLWNMIKTNPQDIYEHYKMLWTDFNSGGVETRKEVFNKVRERYNNEHNPLDFMFIMRTVINGMPRYNKDGKFNNASHFSRPGINPETLKEILFDWSALLNKHDVIFVQCDYITLTPNENDFVYLDPPYAHTKGIYYGGIDTNQLFDYLSKLKCGWILSFDGISGKDNNTFNVPNIYDEHKYINSGVSSIKRLMTQKTVQVYESIYIKK